MIHSSYKKFTQKFSCSNSDCFIKITKPCSLLLEIMMICSLTQTAPFYDCSEQWQIQVYDQPVACNVGQQILAAGCANFESKIIKIYDYAMNYYGRDSEDGFTVLEHELEHLKCRCDFHS